MRTVFFTPFYCVFLKAASTLLVKVFKFAPPSVSRLLLLIDMLGAYRYLLHHGYCYKPQCPDNAFRSAEL